MAQNIPNYELYGNFLADGSSDPIHHETIKERSSKHDWTIRVHRHRRMAQVFLFQSPRVFLRIGDIEHVTQQPTLLIIPPGIPHGFRFAQDVMGDVISVRLDEMPTPLQDRVTTFATGTPAIFAQSDTAFFDQVAGAVAQLAETYRSVSPNRATLLVTLLDLITLYLADDKRNQSAIAAAKKTPGRARTDIQAERFCALLEANYQSQWAVADYAAEVGISAPHLTRICTTVLGAPPNELVRQRRMIEAKRLLEYTALSVSQIADRCGFRDPAFFSRSFKSSVGTTPKAFRLGLEA